MKPRIKYWALLFWLAVKDLYHDRKVSFCIAASIVAVTAPLLLLFGLKHGVVSQLQADLLSDPRNLEIKLLSSGNYGNEWLNRLQQLPETGFAIGLPRSLNTQADLLGDSQQHFVENAEVIPTQPNDPLLNMPQSALKETQTILSARAAERLAVHPGEEVRLRVMRRRDGINELGERKLQVVAVLAPERFNRAAAFVTPELLMGLERFRDGYLIPELGINNGEPLNDLPPSYARARVYAKNINYVKHLQKWLNEQNIETSSRLAEIENVKSINYVLDVIFGVIAGAALIGCIASLTGTFLTNIDRKRRNLALLRLLGFGSPAVTGHVILQALILSASGYIIGVFFYLIGSLLFNLLLSGNQSTHSFICNITFWHGFVAFLLALAGAALVATIGAVRVISIQPAESLREP